MLSYINPYITSVQINVVADGTCERLLQNHSRISEVWRYVIRLDRTTIRRSTLLYTEQDNEVYKTVSYTQLTPTNIKLTTVYFVPNFTT